MSKYKRSQINIGDDILYKDRFTNTDNPDWKVVNKLDQTLLVIEKNVSGVEERRIIDITDVKKVIHQSKN